MREIKFRVWSKRENKMHYSGFCLIPTSPGWSPAGIESLDILNPVEYFDYSAFDWSDANILDGSYVPLQYTGLKDKNGKEIYEGDILRLPPKCKSQVVWSDKLFRWAIKWRNVYNDKSPQFWFKSLAWNKVKDAEVIGNIYENPELLKEVNNAKP